MSCMLSVFVFSYNHQKYIKDCLDSIFAQKVDFDFEVILADDCSTDDTIKKVKNRYADKVRILKRTHNLGLCRSMYEAFSEARGKYIFECAGDDYLLTDHVFQKHVDFLEQNLEYFSVFNYIKTINVQTGKESIGRIPYTEYKLLDFLQGKQPHFYMGTMRNTFKEDDPRYFYSASKNNEEIQMLYYTLSKGKKKIIPEALYAYCFRTGAQNYCSKHTYLDMLDDYARGFRAVEDVDQGKHNFKISKIRYYEQNIDRIIETKDVKLILGIFRVLKFKEILNFVWIKLLMKLNHRRIPAYLIRESRLIK